MAHAASPAEGSKPSVAAGSKAKPDIMAGASVKHPPEPEPPKDGSCPTTFNRLKNFKTGEQKCKCKPDVANGTVWGTGIFTEDSSICGAAVHAGAIKADKGGEVTAKFAPGCASYAGSKKNGVTSSAWGAYAGSFFFPSFGDGKCPPVDPNACPASFMNGKPGADGTIKCTCAATTSGAIYGTAVYTADSSLCAAAVHAGAIPKTGGKVTAKSLAGCSKYESTSANGLTSIKWGSYDASFFFPGFGTGKCP